LTQNVKTAKVLGRGGGDHDTHRHRREIPLLFKLMVQSETDVQLGKLMAQDKIFSNLA